MDYSDLTQATKKYVDTCNLLDDALKAELTALRALKEKERTLHIKYFPKVQQGDMTSAMYNACLKNDCFDEKLQHEASKLNRKMAQNKEHAYKEKLYTLKRTISIH